MTIPFQAEVAIPEVVILEKVLDFGEVRYGNTGSMFMTLKNEWNNVCS